MQISGTIFNVDTITIIKELRSQLISNHIHLLNKIFDSGEDIMVCCPYHKEGQERRPSAGIRKSDGMFHCLACGETHPLPEVISHCFGYNDPFGEQGYKWLVKNFMTVEVQNRETITLNLARDDISYTRSVLDNSGVDMFVTDDELDSYRYTHPYMYKRGLNDNVIELFDIGYDKNTKSITFPVRYWGSVNFGACLFVARRQINEKRFDIPKGIDKPLYGLYEIWLDLQMQAFNRGRGQNAVLKNCPEIYVCEGLFDALRLWCNGKYAVAGFGCLFSDYQVTLLKGLPTRKLVLATDNDDAGLKARQKLRKAINNKLITEVVLPDGRKDIGECTDEEIQNLEQVL